MQVPWYAWLGASGMLTALGWAIDSLYCCLLAAVMAGVVLDGDRFTAINAVGLGVLILGVVRSAAAIPLLLYDALCSLRMTSSPTPLLSIVR